MKPNHQSGLHGFALLAVIVILSLFPILTDTMSKYRQWLMALGLLTIFTLVAGHWVTGAWRGALINDRNRMSLSQIQLVLWTLLVLATYLTGAFVNLSLSDPKPLGIQIPESLWILMGISTTSLIGSPLIISRKKSQKVSQEEEADTLNKLSNQGRKPNELETSGRLMANKKPSAARWSELFEADEVSRAGRLDMSKIQMIFFTLILALVYGTSLARSVASISASGFHDFPTVDESMIALLGISHVGFLTSKAVPERENV